MATVPSRKLGWIQHFSYYHVYHIAEISSSGLQEQWLGFEQLLSNSLAKAKSLVSIIYNLLLSTN